MISSIRDYTTSVYYTAKSFCSKTATFATAFFKAISSPKAKMCTALALACTVSLIVPVANASTLEEFRFTDKCCNRGFYARAMDIIVCFVAQNKNHPFRLREEYPLPSYWTDIGQCRLQLPEFVVWDVGPPLLQLTATNCHFDSKALSTHCRHNKFRLWTHNITK